MRLSGMGEADKSRQAFEALSVREQTELIYFLESLGGRRIYTRAHSPRHAHR